MGTAREEDVAKDLNGNVILGLDISTSTIGISIGAYIHNELKILEITHLKFSQGKAFKGEDAPFLKGDVFKDAISKYKDYNITKIVIEEPLLSSNNVFTVGSLLRFNGLLSQIVYEVFNVVPEYISSYDARKFAFPELSTIRKHNKKGEEYPINKIRQSLKKNDVVVFGSFPFDVDKKEILWGLISDMFPDIEWAYNEKTGELKKENYDASDSLVCILGYVNKFYHGDSESIVSDIKETRTKDGLLIEYVNNFCGKKLEHSMLLTES